MNIDPKVDEAIETLNMKDGPTRRRCSAAPGSSAPRRRRPPARGLRRPPRQQVGREHGRELPEDARLAVLVRQPRHHEPFFGPPSTASGRGALLGLPTPKWGGSTNSLASQMVSPPQTAISAKAAGIATTVSTPPRSPPR